MDWTKYLKDHWQVGTYGFAYANRHKEKVIEKVVEYWEGREGVAVGESGKKLLIALCYSLYFTGVAYVYREDYATGEVVVYHAMNPYMLVAVAGTSDKAPHYRYHGGQEMGHPMPMTISFDRVDKIVLGVVGPALTEKIAEEQNI